MRKNLIVFMSLLLVFSLVLTACEPAAEPEEETFSVGMITDMGGVDDKSFNATSWAGVERAIEELGVEGSFLESRQQTDYATNIMQYINQDTDLIITVGFLLADDTAEFAERYPEQHFAIVDMPSLADNVRGLTFATDEAGFLAGYAAAAATQTGRVATFGGINIPPVSIFMVGFEYGVNYYNEQHGTDVEVLGWNTEANTGVFVGNFDSTDDGRQVAETFLNEGADIVMPVAGPVGLGSAQAVRERGTGWIIGVDTDWTISAPEYSDIIFTSVMKNMDVAVFDSIETAMADDFTGFGGETYVGTLENDGVGLASLPDGVLPDGFAAELEQVRQAIIAGTIDTGWASYISGLE